MKLFTYLFVSVLLLGGCYFLFIHEDKPAVATPASTWEAEAQTHLSTLLADQIQITTSQNWTAFETHLKKAEAHLDQAPADAKTDNFRIALAAYRSQVNLHTQAQNAP